MRVLKSMVLVAAAMALTLCTITKADAYSFDMIGGDTLTFMEDFDDNSAGWTLVGTEISNASRVVQGDDGSGGCSASAAGNAVGQVHLDEDDGENSYAGTSGGYAYLDLATQVDTSGGPASMYGAMVLMGVGGVPRQAFGLAQAAHMNWDNASETKSDVRVEWLQGFQFQFQVTSNGVPACCGPTWNCGKTAPGHSGGACPTAVNNEATGLNGPACSGIDFRIHLPGGNAASVQQRGMGGTTSWEEIMPPSDGATTPGWPSHDLVEGTYDRLLVWLESNGVGGGRNEAVALSTGGVVPVEVSSFQID